jgi:hypothetical protein
MMLSGRLILLSNLIQCVYDNFPVAIIAWHWQTSLILLPKKDPSAINVNVWEHPPHQSVDRLTSRQLKSAWVVLGC